MNIGNKQQISLETKTKHSNRPSGFLWKSSSFLSSTGNDNDPQNVCTCFVVSVHFYLWLFQGDIRSFKVSDIRSTTVECPRAKKKPAMADCFCKVVNLGKTPCGRHQLGWANAGISGIESIGKCWESFIGDFMVHLPASHGSLQRCLIIYMHCK